MRSVEESCIIMWSDEPVKPLRGLLLEFTLFCVWDVAHFVFGGWQWDGFLRTPGDARQLVPNRKSIQALANEVGSRLSFGTVLFSELVGKFQELLGNRFWLGKAIRFVLCQDIPDR